MKARDDARMKELDQLSHDVADLLPALGLIQNYISCLQLDLNRAETNSDRLFVIYSLDQENGFDNIQGVLTNTEEKLTVISNTLLDHSEGKEEADERV